MNNELYGNNKMRHVAKITTIKSIYIFFICFMSLSIYSQSNYGWWDKDWRYRKQLFVSNPRIIEKDANAAYYRYKVEKRNRIDTKSP